MAEQMEEEFKFSEVAEWLSKADDETGLLLCTGAGMSVASGVPVFRYADGTMTKEFQKFLFDYNAARRKAGLSEVDDWFGFSVPEMFNRCTEVPAWDYWRWRTLRARVDLADDYTFLMNIVKKFGVEKTFCITSNCDMLHVQAGMPEEKVYEIHGSLGYVQCSDPSECPSGDSIKNVSSIETDLQAKRVPRCADCSCAMRPNVMIFGDGKLVESRLEKQEDNLEEFLKKYKKLVVIEIGAGMTVPSIRCHAVRNSKWEGSVLVRVNPGQKERKNDGHVSNYISLPCYGGVACKGIWDEFNKST